MAKFDAYVICTSPRSGSTLLCELLAATGLAGNPDSYFHRPSISAWCKDLGLTPDPSLCEREILGEIFKAAIAEGSIGTGMFGVRLQRHSFDFFARQLDIHCPGLPGDAARIRAAFGRTAYVYLMRRDKIEQAVSYVKATHSGLWHMAPDGTELERLAPPREPVYDATELKAQYDEMIQAEHDWERWFELEGIVPLRITYEALAADTAATLGRVLGHLGLDETAAIGMTPPVAKLADNTSRDWADRLRSDLEGS